MTEAVAWMYERRPEAYPPTKMLVALERRLDISELQFWTETPLYPAEALAAKDARIAEQAKEIERLGSLAKANNDLARMEVAYRKQLAFQRAEMANALEAVTSQYGDRLPAQFLADLTAMLMRPALRAGVVVEKHDDA